MAASLVSYGRLRPAFIGSLAVVFKFLIEQVGKGAIPGRLQNLGDLVELSDSGIWGEESTEPETDFKVFRVADFKGDFCLDYDNAPLRTLPQNKKARFKLLSGDLLIVKSSGSAKQVVSGRVAVFDQVAERCYAASNFLMRIRFKADCEPHYIAFALGSPPIREEIANLVKTMTYPNLSYKIYRSIRVPIVPVADQKKIAAFFRAVLDQQSQPDLPSYLSEQSRIISRIDELAAKVRQGQLLRSESTSRLNALIESHLSAIFQSLAAKYGLQPLDSLIMNANYGTSRKCDPTRISDAVPVLRIPNVASEQVNQVNLKYAVLPDSEFKQVQIHEGDILVVRTNGSADLVGRCAVVPSVIEPTAFASYLIRLRVTPELAYPDYVQLMLKHLRTDGNLIDFARTTAGQYNVSLGRLRVAQIPVPPLQEQREIVNQIRNLEAETVPLRSLQTQTAAELDALMPSILSKAFRGEL